MKIIHTADWHLGNVFHGHDRLAEHKHFLEWLLARLGEQQPDALLLTGDVFDTPRPSAASEALFYDFLVRATDLVPGMQMVIIAGDCDSAARIEAPAELLRLHDVYVRGVPPFIHEGTPDLTHYLLPLSPRNSHEAACVCFALPYLRPDSYECGLTPEQGLAAVFAQLHKKFRKSDFSPLPVMVAAHFYAAGATPDAAPTLAYGLTGADEPVDLRVIGSGVSYVALGHLHGAQQVASGSTLTCYAGSPLPMSFDEAGNPCGVQMVEIDSEGSATAERLVYTPVRSLQTIPATGRAATSASEVLEALKQLPKRSKQDAESAGWPYLEIRMEAQGVTPDLLDWVMELTADREVHLCRMVCVHPDMSETASVAGHSLEPRETLCLLNPLQLAQKCYAARYAEEMPQPLTDRLKQAVEAANNK